MVLRRNRSTRVSEPEQQLRGEMGVNKSNECRRYTSRPTFCNSRNAVRHVGAGHYLPSAFSNDRDDLNFWRRNGNFIILKGRSILACCPPFVRNTLQSSPLHPSGAYISHSQWQPLAITISSLEAPALWGDTSSSSCWLEETQSPCWTLYSGTTTPLSTLPISASSKKLPQRCRRSASSLDITYTKKADRSQSSPAQHA